MVALRAGHGQWSPIQDPAPGVLWLSDDGVIGFECLPAHDRQPVMDVLAEHGVQAWTILTAGRKTFTGNLDNWEKDQ